jgi:hypothetical protein
MASEDQPRKGKPGRGQPPAIEGLPKELRDKCIDLMMQGKKGCDAEVARLAGVSRQAVFEYRRRHFAKAVELAGKIARAEAIEAGEGDDVTAIMARQAPIVKDVAGALPILAVRDNRLAAQQDRHNRMRLVMEERAADMAEVPGGKSGLLVRQIKQIGNGDSAREVEEYKLDAGLLSEFREHEKQIAQELGQWQEGTSGPAVAIQIVCPAGVSTAQPSITATDDGCVTIDIAPGK